MAETRAAGAPVSEVKGAWFVSAQAYLGAEGVLPAVLAAVPVAHRPALVDPTPSAWYPEAALQATLGAMRKVHATTPTAFVDAIDACTVIGTSRFFRALLALSTPAFVLRRVPTMWGKIRRGAGEVSVETADGTAIVRYRAFPYFADENYRLLTVGSLRAVVRTTTARTPSVEIVHATDLELDVRVRW